MSPWLKPRLVALFCGAVFIGGAMVLHAQNNVPAPAKTPEEAALNFYRLLDAHRFSTTPARRYNETPVVSPLAGSIERAQFQALSGQDDDRFYAVLAEQAAKQPFEAKVQSSRGDETIVLVSPSARPLKRDVVVVAEDGGFRVDVVATYARWNNLSGIEADKSLYRATGFISPALLGQRSFLGEATNPLCQTRLKQLSLGILQYVQDYDERMPPARRWQSDNVLQPYVKSRDIFNCPALPTGSNGYAFNSKLSQVPFAGINESATTINLYETSNLKGNVFGPFTGRAYRHQIGGKDGMNIAFADGHIKWFARGARSALTINPDAPSAGLLTISTQGAK